MGKDVLITVNKHLRSAKRLMEFKEEYQKQHPEKPKFYWSDMFQEMFDDLDDMNEELKILRARVFEYENNLPTTSKKGELVGNVWDVQPAKEGVIYG